MRIISFDFVCDQKSQILILGTMPGRLSLLHKQYYANPGNCFWEMMLEIFKEEPTFDYTSKKEMLLDNTTALWDVLESCVRKSSADSDIIDPVANDFKSFFCEYPNIHTVIFNGGNAMTLYKKFVVRSLSDDTKQYLKLPSTSPANARLRKREKYHLWKEAICGAFVDIP